MLQGFGDLSGLDEFLGVSFYSVSCIALGLFSLHIIVFFFPLGLFVCLFFSNFQFQTSFLLIFRKTKFVSEFRMYPKI